VSFRIHRVVLRNYRSIAACDVRLGKLVFLVGPNGAGKNNFLDALRLVADGLRSTLDTAIRERGGIGEVRRRSAGHPTHLDIEVAFTSGDSFGGTYGIGIAAQKGGGYEVSREECSVFDPTFHYFKRTAGRPVESSPSEPVLPVVGPDRLYLVTASSLPVFRPVYDGLTGMGFYNFNPDAVRIPQSPDPGELLARDGRNLAAVVHRLGRYHPAVKARIEEYLGLIVPTIHGIDRVPLGPTETLEFRQDVPGAAAPWRFTAGSMSDGTLRALGVLVALFQQAPSPAVTSLIGIEEPEAALHPGAAGVLYDALRYASDTRQVLVTSHSPDLLDNDDVSDVELLAVESRAGETLLGPIDEVSRRAVRERLYTPGELLRLNQLSPGNHPPAALTG